MEEDLLSAELAEKLRVIGMLRHGFVDSMASLEQDPQRAEAILRYARDELKSMLALVEKALAGGDGR